MQIGETAVGEISEIVELVLHRLREVDDHPSCPVIMPGAGGDGVFPSVNESVDAAREAQQELMRLTREGRGKIIEAIRRTALQNALSLAEETVSETGMGRVAHKELKNRLAALKTPGLEDLETYATSGDHGLTVVERSPLGIIGAITPITNPNATIINNAISMIAAGNAVVFSPHPGARNTSLKTIRLINQAIVCAGGPGNLVSSPFEPSLDQARVLISHPEVRALVATGGPGVVKAVMTSGKKAIGAGAGNPPVVVDETADLEKAGRDIVAGSSFDNNLPCIAEKEVFVVDQAADQLLGSMKRAGAYLLREPDNLVDLLSKKSFLGRDAGVILAELGIIPAGDVPLIVVEVPADHPFVLKELMAPILPVVRVRDINQAIDMAVWAEQGNRHTAVIHSKNVDRMTRFARAIQTTVFVKNGPSYAGLGYTGEGHTTFTIAGPTGEGLTSARTFTRQRRCVLVDAFSIV